MNHGSSQPWSANVKHFEHLGMPRITSSVFLWPLILDTPRTTSSAMRCIIALGMASCTCQRYHLTRDPGATSAALPAQCFPCGWQLDFPLGTSKERWKLRRPPSFDAEIPRLRLLWHWQHWHSWSLARWECHRNAIECQYFPRWKHGVLTRHVELCTVAPPKPFRRPKTVAATLRTR